MSVSVPGPPRLLDTAPSPFAGVHPVVHLPLHADGSIEPSGIARQVDHLLKHGVSGVVTLGLATEVWTLTDVERELICRLTTEAVDGRVPVTAGVDGDTATALRRGAAAVAAGAAALMVRPPAGSDAHATEMHVGRLAREIPVPILVQDAPQATGVDLSVGALLASARLAGASAAVKVEALDALPKVTRLTAAGVDVVAGWGGVGYVDAIIAGAVGCMPGSDLGPAFVAIDRLSRRGDLVGARRAYSLIEELLLVEAASLELLIASAKRALHRCGVLTSARTRCDVSSVRVETLRRLDELFAQLGQSGVPGW